MRKGNLTVYLFASVLTIFMGIEPAMAADTVETWDIGATDVDLYTGFDGIGQKKYDRTIYGDIMLGYGLASRFSAYLGTTLQGNEYLSNGSGNIYLGIFGTPVETNHFDIDLFLDISLGGTGFSEFQITPSTELNYDLDSDMSSWGVYLRTGVPLYGHSTSTLANPDVIDHEMVYHFETTLGTYWTMVEGHQLLLEYDMGFRPSPEDDERITEVGGIALGYNVVISDSLELINQIYVDIPQQGESVAAGVMIGIIATLPSN
jgi:hypothetical protein